MKSKWLGLVFAAITITACEQAETPCEQTSAEVRGILQECGVRFEDYPANLGSPCTDTLQNIYGCYLDCYQEASCEAILFEDEAGYLAFNECRRSCLELTE